MMLGKLKGTNPPSTQSTSSPGVILDDEDQESLDSISCHSKSDHHYGSSHDGDEDSAKYNKGNNNNDDDAPEQIGRQETLHVFRLRLCVFGALFLAAAAVSITVFLITHGSEEESFETSFESKSHLIINSFHDGVELKISALVSLGVSITSRARLQNATWPFFTMNDFQQRAASARASSTALFIELLPMVSDDNREKWEKYAVNNLDWLSEGRAFQEELQLETNFTANTEDFQHIEEVPVTNIAADNELEFSSGIGSRIYTFDEDSNPVVDPGPGPYFPIWETSPILHRDLVNYNVDRYSGYAESIHAAYNTGKLVIGDIKIAEPGDISHPDPTTSFFSYILSFARGTPVAYKGDPFSSLYIPVFNDYNYISNKEEKPVAVIVAVVNWASNFENVLTENTAGMVVVLENTCSGPYTFGVDGTEVKYIGEGNLHDPKYDSYERTATLDNLLDRITTEQLGIKLNLDECVYSIRVYPSSIMKDLYITKLPVVLTLSIGIIFVFTAIMFCIYDRLVERRQRLVLRTAEQSSAIVSSLFPEVFRQRLMKDAENDNKKKSAFNTPQSRLKSYLANGTTTDDNNKFSNNEDDELDTDPIADLFPHCTVLFCDIAGFTAWSSTRDPAQVFILLQTIYQAFDVIAKRFHVFKVETIGDSYVAVTGLPNPQEKHAVLMARFAWSCMRKFNELAKKLEVSLGPDTADLAMRFGLHSGPVTAGILKGDRQRFQLFGDTVNTAARMESTGTRNKIQVSSNTAALLVAANKGHWIIAREDAVEAKGKGLMETHWLHLVPDKPGSKNPSNTDSSDYNCEQVLQDLGPEAKHLDTKLLQDNLMRQNRLVNWITDLLFEHVKTIASRRENPSSNKTSKISTTQPFVQQTGTTCLDEVAEVIQMPKFNSKVALQASNRPTVQGDDVVLEQLRSCVSIIASTYRNNPFHNFEHACHVTMSTEKFLKRIVTPDLDLNDSERKSVSAVSAKLHEYTHGINSDPLTLFAIVFSALVHDADHRGVSNAQLMKEDTQLAALYRNKSVAEQNSLDIAWNVLMSKEFTELRNSLFATEDDLKRFRQVLVNVVLATDIFDKELNDLRKNRWVKAFDPNCQGLPDRNDRRATIVIEHIIQASDVAHTMQHWHIYRKWNGRLFEEMVQAYHAGRMAVNPADFWYQGELGFFDNYVIPLAKKLKDCCVFGASSDECLNYAIQNRDEWQRRGQEIVADLVEKHSTSKQQ